MYILNLIFSFLLPSIKLNSGKKIYIKGNGPPMLFSTGLFGTMPNFLYSNIQNKLSKNISLILTEDYKPLQLKDINEIVNILEVDYISLFAHSSIDATLLTSDKINKAILCDPITIPDINLKGFNNKKIKTDSELLIIQAEKLYNSDRQLPNFQTPKFPKNKIISEIIYKNVGHPDILNNIWADFASNTKLWRSITPIKNITEFSKWKYKNNKNYKNTIISEREKYKNYITNKTINFII